MPFSHWTTWRCHGILSIFFSGIRAMLLSYEKEDVSTLAYSTRRFYRKIKSKVYVSGDTHTKNLFTQSQCALVGGVLSYKNIKP